MNMNKEQTLYHGRVITDPHILVGKPVVKGTRISVELVLEYLTHTPDLDELFADYPELTREDVKAVLAYAQAAVGDLGRSAARRRADGGGLLGAGPAPRV